MDPHPHTYVENEVPAHQVGIINPITDAGPLFLSEKTKKKSEDSDEDAAPSKSDKGK
jgi:hypothetical protein